MHSDIRHAHILDTPILGPKVGAAKAAPTAPCAPGLLCEAKFVQLASHLCEASPQWSSWGHVILKGVAKSGKPFASS